MRCRRSRSCSTDDGIILLKYWLAVDQARAGRTLRRTRRRSAQALEALAGRPGRAQKYAEMGKLRDVMIERTHTVERAVVRGRFQRPEARPHQPDPASAEQVPLDDKPIAEVKLPKLKGKPKTEHVTDKAVLVPDTF